MDRMLGILKVKMSLEYPTFETAFESGLRPRMSLYGALLLFVQKKTGELRMCIDYRSLNQSDEA